MGQSKRFEVASALTRVSTQAIEQLALLERRWVERTAMQLWGRRYLMIAFDFRARIPLMTLILSLQVFSSFSHLLCGLLNNAIAPQLSADGRQIADSSVRW